MHARINGRRDCKFCMNECIAVFVELAWLVRAATFLLLCVFFTLHGKKRYFARIDPRRGRM